MKQILVLLSLFITQTFSETFPLQGQTWVLMNGKTKLTHIVESVAPFTPSIAIVVNFGIYGTVDMRYSNLQGRFFRSTAEAMDAVRIDFRRNILFGSKNFTAAKKVLPDTSYSCDEALYSLSKTLRYGHYFQNGEEVTPIPSALNFYAEAPECYATRPATTKDKSEKDLCQSHVCSDPEEKSGGETCNDTYSECRYLIGEGEMTLRPSTKTFWNLHVFPKIVFHPRHYVTGRVMTEIEMTEGEAEQKRAQAISSGREDMKNYLNPVFDDSASVYFSGQFLLPKDGTKNLETISFDVGSSVEGGTSFYHDPKSAYRVYGFADDAGIQKALLLPFAKDDSERVFLEQIDMRCPGWMAKDNLIGQKAFFVKQNLTVTLPDILPIETSDPAWKRIRQEKVTTPDGVEVRTFVEEDKDLTGQTALVRNPEFLLGDYTWRGCPDMPDPLFHMTKSEMVRFLALEPPTCNKDALREAPEVYRRMGSKFSRTEEIKERALSEERAREAEFLYERVKDKVMPKGAACPETPLDIVLGRLR